MNISSTYLAAAELQEPENACLAKLPCPIDHHILQPAPRCNQGINEERGTRVPHSGIVMYRMRLVNKGMPGRKCWAA